MVVTLAGCDRSDKEIVTQNPASVNAASELHSRSAILGLIAIRDYDTLLHQRDELNRLAGGNDPQLAAAAFAALMTVDGYVDPAWELAWSNSDGFVKLLAAMPLLVDSQLRIELAERAMPLLDDASLSLLSGWPADQRLTARRAVLTALPFVPGREAEIRDALEVARQDVALHATATSALERLGIDPSEVSFSPPRKLVQQYTMSDLESALNWPAGSRSFARGRRVYHEVGCHRCHVRSEHDTLVGPSLTAAGYQPSRRELAEAIVDPNRKIDDNYRQYLLIVDGKPITGLVTEQTSEYLVMIADPMFDCTPQRVERDQLDGEPEPLTTSAMPSGMVAVLSRKELLDLLAYVEAKGNPQDASFRQRESP